MLDDGAGVMEDGYATIDALLAASPGWLDPLDVHTAGLLGDLAGETDAAVRLALALASRQVRRGHVCLEVRATAATAGPVDDEGRLLRATAATAESMDDEGQVQGPLRWPEAEDWLRALAASRLVATVSDCALPGAPPPEPVPLVLEQPSGRLYLRRWWEHEAALAALLETTRRCHGGARRPGAGGEPGPAVPARGRRRPTPAGATRRRRWRWRRDGSWR